MQPDKHTQEQARQWVVKNNPYDQARFKYYSKLHIPLPTVVIQPQQTHEKEDISIDLVSRGNDEIRKRYIEKLGLSHIQTPKQCQHVYIFDWDDTLLPTTFLNSVKFKVNEEAKELLNKLDELVIKLLKKMLQSKKDPDLIIVTNGTKGWVETSSSLYLPKTSKFINEEKIPVVSARNMFGEEYPDEYERWKVQTFKTLPANYKINLHVLTNMLCIGDSNLEMQAANCLSKSFQKIVLKTVKLRQNPRPTQLIKQLQLLVEKVIDIIGSVKGLTIKMQRK